MEIQYLPKFLRQYKKLPDTVQVRAEKAEMLFRNNPFDIRLKTHKLSGVLEGRYAFSVTHNYRIIFRFIDGQDIVRFYAIGTHDIYD